MDPCAAMLLHYPLPQPLPATATAATATITDYKSIGTLGTSPTIPIHLAVLIVLITRSVRLILVKAISRSPMTGKYLPI
jgi:hypothetical protein